MADSIKNYLKGLDSNISFVKSHVIKFIFV